MPGPLPAQRARAAAPGPPARPTRRGGTCSGSAYGILACSSSAFPSSIELVAYPVLILAGSLKPAARSSRESCSAPQRWLSSGGMAPSSLELAVQDTAGDAGGWRGVRIL